MLKKFFGGGRVWGVGCGVWGFTHFQGVNYLIFREKVPEISLPNHSNRWHFLISKKPKDIIQQGF
ncbi:MAG: hypothetical protein DWQ53_01200 [Microcystis flos-aquae DF17]|uniref:Type IV pilin PilA n=4 Tax=Microcystis TaxID=1125 RepID=A0A552LNS0_9CHRO|nr:hypothetical protein [Microcystis aeruginosa]REJ50302.1 MAG: hypothetical protein DWQ53_01200 [Microcystis flos-aquae DF17]TRT83405.1 MAG: hypothetical protein EWV63_17555 [Microcystis aeruginosa Ma_OC_H_19870700_S124]TRV21867.1 MAG: hypothetical protein EWV40_11025 [Microcystis flos-aquae Mf_WU_F_19750830_S460]OPF15258.1 hypothetical protein B1L04_22265 [Microcystis aeruginosa KW]BAG04957.1 unknown protein [Microcystis aeruginosa NIES-843]